MIEVARLVNVQWYKPEIPYLRKHWIYCEVKILKKSMIL